MQQSEHSSVNKSRPAGEEVTGTSKKGVTDKLDKMKKRKREVKVLFKRKLNFNYFPWPRLKTALFCDGHTQNLLWVYGMGMAWMWCRSYITYPCWLLLEYTFVPSSLISAIVVAMFVYVPPPAD